VFISAKGREVVQFNRISSDIRHPERERERKGAPDDAPDAAGNERTKLGELGRV
jgi:hypothetical protein